jgi:hypothetical protein
VLPPESYLKRTCARETIDSLINRSGEDMKISYLILIQLWLILMQPIQAQNQISKDSIGIENSKNRIEPKSELRNLKNGVKPDTTDNGRRQNYKTDYKKGAQNMNNLFSLREFSRYNILSRFDFHVDESIQDKFRESMSGILLTEYGKRFRYDLGLIGHYLGIAKNLLVLVICIISL